jgi:hypothetical protein
MHASIVHCFGGTAKIILFATDPDDASPNGEGLKK